MNSKTMRRLAAEHSQLHTQGLPHNYLWPPSSAGNSHPDDLTVLNLLLAGPASTPFQSGLFSLVLNIPPTYPTAPPTATFRTKIFHPNVDPATGAVCVDTLKRDWTPETRLRDVLVVISCLLVSPNPASALNAEAGRLCEHDFAAFERRARTWAGVHARVPGELERAVAEARGRGETRAAQQAAPESSVAGARRGRGKRRLAGAGEDLENDRDAKRRSGSRSPTSARGIRPLAAGSDNALGIVVSSQTDSAGSAGEGSKPMESTSERLPTGLTASRGATGAGLMPPTALRSQDFPTFTTLNTTFQGNRVEEAQQAPSLFGAEHLTGATVSTISRSSWTERQQLEADRFQAAGGDMKKYNTGAFGVRTGLLRL